MKIHRRKSKKRYLGKKNVYEYDVLSVTIPAKFHKTVEPFLYKDLDIEIKSDNNKITIVLKPQENVSVNRNTLSKNM
jgi:hypothetical protein